MSHFTEVKIPIFIVSIIVIVAVCFFATWLGTLAEEPQIIDSPNGDLHFEIVPEGEGWLIDEDGTMTYQEPKQKIEKPIVYYDDLIPQIPESWETIILTNVIQLPLEINFHDKTGEYLGIIEVDLKWHDEHSGIWQSFQEGYWIEFTWNGKEIMAFKTDKEKEK